MRPRDPESYQFDPGYLAAFVLVLVLIVGVGYRIYTTTSFDANRIQWPDPFRANRTPDWLKSAAGDVRGPLVIPTATPAAASALSVRAPTAVPTVWSPPATSGASAVQTGGIAPAVPTAIPVAPAKPTPATVTGRMKVGNTSGDGVYIRRTPRLADRLAAYADNTPMELLGETADGDGVKWQNVRDPRGNVGWIPQQYLVPDTAPPPAPRPPAPAIQAGGAPVLSPPPPAPATKP